MITLRVPRDEWLQTANELNLNRAVLEKLRKLDVPVIGGLSIRGVERGRLSMTWSPDGQTMIFEWVDGTAPVLPLKGDDEW